MGIRENFIALNFALTHYKIYGGGFVEAFKEYKKQRNEIKLLSNKIKLLGIAHGKRIPKII